MTPIITWRTPQEEPTKLNIPCWDCRGCRRMNKTRCRSPKEGSSPGVILAPSVRKPDTGLWKLFHASTSPRWGLELHLVGALTPIQDSVA